MLPLGIVVSSWIGNRNRFVVLGTRQDQNGLHVLLKQASTFHPSFEVFLSGNRNTSRWSEVMLPLGIVSLTKERANSEDDLFSA